ncbi:Calx-beta domain-containing protein [Rubrivirga sp.]|uniref:DUF7933 domain-containing protein n=1 Tax=Rubrivirga sp. TaxID=1885344 RepID=UPI003B52FD4C
MSVVQHPVQFLLTLIVAVGLFGAASTPAHAQSSTLQFYFGQDKPSSPIGGSDSSPATESQIQAAIAGGDAAAARAAFDGRIRLPSVGVESFESPTFTANNTGDGSGYLATVPVSFQGSGNSPETSETIGGTFQGTGTQYSIRSDRKYGTFPALGTQFLASTEGNIKVTFNEPVSAFGFYGTDIGEGSTQKVRLDLYPVGATTPTATRVVDGISAPSGGILFFGFTDQATRYERVDITTLTSADGPSSEYFGFDSFITADVNQVAGAEFADLNGTVSDPGDNVDGADSAVEGETVRLLFRTDGTGAGSVTVAVTGGTGGSADVDGFTSQAVSIVDGHNIAALPIRTTDDNLPDDGETVVFEITAATGSFADSYAVGQRFTLTIGDPLPAFSQSLAPTPAVEGQPATVTVTIDNTGRGVTATGIEFSTALPASLPVDAPANVVSTCGGAAGVSGQTLSASGGSVGPGQVCTVTVDVTPASAGTARLAAVTVTTDSGQNEAPAVDAAVVRGVSFDAASATASEGDTVALAATLSSAAPAGGLSVEVALTGGAAADLDAYAVQTISFGAGASTGSASFTVADDGLREGAETLTFSFQDPSAGVVPAGQTTTDLDVAASLATGALTAGAGQTSSGTVVSATVDEGGSVTVTVTLTDAAVGDESVDLVFAPSAPTTGSAADVDETTVALAFAAGATTASATLDAVQDGRAEGDELLRFALANAVHLDLGDPDTFDLTVSASGAGVAFAAATGSAAEGGTATITLTSAVADDGDTAVVTLDGASSTGTSADLGGFTSATVTFTGGVATLDVPVTTDRRAEAAETFAFDVSGAVLDPDGEQTFTLTVARSNAEAAFAQSTLSAEEGQTVQLVVTLSSPALGDESVTVALTSGDPADLGGFTSETVPFAAGATTATVAVPITEDGVADDDETFTFALQGATFLDPGTPATATLSVGRTGALVSFATNHQPATENAGTVEVVLQVHGDLAAPASVLVSLLSGSPADLGGFTEKRVDLPWGNDQQDEVVVEIPITDDRLREGVEVFVFALSEPTGNAPDGVSSSDDSFALIVQDNDGNDGTDVATVPATTSPSAVGARLFGVPVGGLTVAELAAALGGEPAPTVYVVDAAGGALVVPDPALVLDAGQAVYVEGATGDALTLTGSAPDGPVTFVGGADAETGRVRVAVSNPAGAPVDLARLRVEGGTLADVVLVLDPATGALVPVSLSALAAGEAVLPPYATVLVEVDPSGDPADVRVTLDPDEADGALPATGLRADACGRAPGDAGVVCLALGSPGRSHVGDRAVVRLRSDDGQTRGLAEPPDWYDLQDVAARDAQLTVPGGAEGALALATASVVFESTVTVPLSVAVGGPGLYTLALTRPVGGPDDDRFEVVLLDGDAEVALDTVDAYRFEVGPEEDLTGRFALRVGREVAVASGHGPSLVDRVGRPYPNPSAGAVTVEVEVTEAQALRVTVFDAVGRVVLVPFDGPAAPGAPLRVALDATGLAPGVYVVHVAGETVREARRLTVAR